MLLKVRIIAESTEARRIPTDASTMIEKLTINSEMILSATHLIEGWYRLSEIPAWVRHTDCYISEIIEPYDPDVDSYYDFSNDISYDPSRYDPDKILSALEISKVPANLVHYTDRYGNKVYMPRLIEDVNTNISNIENIKDTVDTFSRYPDIPMLIEKPLMMILSNTGDITWGRISDDDLDQNVGGNNVLYDQF